MEEAGGSDQPDIQPLYRTPQGTVPTPHRSGCATLHPVEVTIHRIANFHPDGYSTLIGFGTEKPPEEKVAAKGRTLVRQRTDTGHVSLVILNLLRYTFYNYQFINTLTSYAAKVIFLFISSKPHNFASEENRTGIEKSINTE